MALSNVLGVFYCIVPTTDRGPMGQARLRGRISLERVFPASPAELVACVLGLLLGTPVGAAAVLGARMLGFFGSVGHRVAL